MSDYSTIQQHQPLRAPNGWGTQERRFIAQLEEILDDVYRRFGRLSWSDLGTALKKRLQDADGKVSQLEQTAQQFEVKLSQLGTPEELINAIMRITHEGIFLMGGEVSMQTDEFSVTSLKDGEEMLHLDEQGLDAPLVSADVIRSPSVLSVWQGGETLPFAGSIGASLNNLPLCLMEAVTLTVPEGTYAEDVVISGLCGPGSLTISMAGAVMQGSVRIVHCACPVHLTGGTLAAAQNVAVEAVGCAMARLSGMKMQGRESALGGSCGAVCESGCLHIEGCVFERMTDCILARSGGRITAVNNTGGTSGGLYSQTANTNYALHALTGGMILAEGTCPCGMLGTSSPALNTPGAACVFGSATETSTAGEVVETVTAVTLTSVDYGRLRIATDATSSAFTGSLPFQGRSFGYDNWGAWFFDLTGMGTDFTQATLTISRADAWGSDDAVNITIYPHAWQTRPTSTFSRTTLDAMFASPLLTVSMARGETVTLTLPDSAVTGLKDGSICGFAVARTGSYAQLGAQCTLTMK